MLHTGTMLRINAENPHESDCFVMNAMNVEAILWTACCCQKYNGSEAIFSTAARSIKSP